MLPSVVKAAAVTSALAGIAAAQFPADKNIPPSLDLATLPNNSLYLRWRPQYHVLAPNGHMNDPCGPMYDAARDTYHIFYQSFPQHVNFGNTSWGHATSADLVTWTDVGGWRGREFVAISPNAYSVPSYDWLGDFSGGAYPVGLSGKNDGNLTLMFTGEVLLPDNWQLPYRLGPPYATEMQNIATSSDGGRTWQKWEGNPWLNGQPGHWNVTGLRDPVFAPNPALDAVLKRPESFYLTVGSGIRDVGPRIPLYSAKASDLTKWTFEGALFEPPINYTWGGDRTKTGNWGANFELAGFYDAPVAVENGGDGKTTKWIATFGAEGYADPWHPLAHWSLFAIGDLARRHNGSAALDIQASGVLDWGNLYALNQFYDAKHARRVLWGWSDEDLNNTALLQQGFQGSLGLPRELFLQTSHHVLAPRGGPPVGPAIWEKEADGKSYAVTTLAQRPLPDVVAAVQGEGQTCFSRAVAVDSAVPLRNVKSSRFHLQATLEKLPPSTKDSYVGVAVRQSPKSQELTEIRYYPANGSVVLDRSRSSLLPTVVKSTYVGHWEPYRYENGTTEPMVLDVFVDGSLLEIFVNNRFSLTSRIYPSRADALGASLISSGCKPMFSAVKYWPMALNVWPQRPLNASSPLLFDPYYETHITFKNPYLPVDYTLYAGN